MKSDLFWLSIPVSLINLFISSNIAIAAYFNPLTGYSEADLAREINNGIFVEEFNAISNIVPPQTVDEKSSSKKQFLGKNGEKVDFQRSFDGEILKYQVDKEVLNAINVNEAGFDINGMILSASSTKNGQTKLSNLVFDDGSMSTVDLISKKRKIDFLKISGIDNTFTLSGTQVFSWIGERPENKDLAYKIRVGTFQEPKSNLYTANSASRLSAIEVPETKTISLFSLLLVGMVFTHLRR